MPCLATTTHLKFKVNTAAISKEERIRLDQDDAKALHVVVFDEFDAIAGARTDGAAEGSRAANSVVNQLLAKIDGDKSINFTLT